MNKIEIPKTIDEKLSKHSEQFGISKQELETELVENLPKVKADYPKISEQKQILLAYRALIARLAQEEGGLKSKAINHVGFFIGDSGIKDESQKKINKIKRMSAEDQKLYHPDENTWLNYKEGKDYMKPITPLYHRVLYGIASSGSEFDAKRTQFMKLELWNDAVRSIAPDHNVVYNFRANPKASDKQLPFYALNAASSTRLRPVVDVVDEEEKYNLIVNSGKDIFSIGDVDMIYETRFKFDPTDKTFRERSDPVFIEASVSNIRIREDKSNIINLYDETDTGIAFATAYIPHTLPIKFKEQDRVVFLAELRPLKFENAEEEKVCLFVKGFFVVPLDSELNNYI